MTSNNLLTPMQEEISTNSLSQSGKMKTQVIEVRPKYQIKHWFVKDPIFPYLYMELRWANNLLYFRTYHKPKQRIKYVDQTSIHTRQTIKAIPYGVIQRLAGFTSRESSIQNKTIDMIYPEHSQARRKAKLISDFPTFKEVWNEYDTKNLQPRLLSTLKTTHTAETHTLYVNSLQAGLLPYIRLLKTRRTKHWPG